MAVTVSSEIVIDGVKVPTTAADLMHTGEAAIRGFRIRWGRDDYLDSQTSPASVTLYVAELNRGKWSSRIFSGSAIGMTVEIYAVIDDPDNDLSFPRLCVFRGRINNATAQPAGRMQGSRDMRWEIEITAADRTADLGNVIVNELNWARGSMRTRANQILDLADLGNAEIEAMYFWPGYINSWARPLAETNVSALRLLEEFYASMGNDSYSYDPNGNVIRQAIRLDQALDIGLEVADAATGEVAPYVGDIWVDQVRYTGIAIDGGEITATPEFSASVDTAINRFENTWKWNGDNHSKDYVFVWDYQTAGDARRVYAWSSWLDENAAINSTMENVYYKVTQEGAQPKHPGIIIPPRHTFDNVIVAQWLLQTWENTRPVFIYGDRGSAWIASGLNYPPVYAPIGGELAYEPREGWSIAMTIQKFRNQKTVVDSLRWSDLKQPTDDRDLSWGEPEPGAGLRFAPRLSWTDMYYIPWGNRIIRDALI